MKKLNLAVMLAMISFSFAQAKGVATRAPVGERHEINLSTTAGTMTFGNNNGVFAIAGGYDYFIHPPFQLGLNFGFATGVGTLFTLTAGPTVNFPFDVDIHEAFFATAQAGLSVVQSVAGFDFIFLVGKRFHVLERINYRPDIGIQVLNSSLFFVIHFLQASITF